MLTFLSPRSIPPMYVLSRPALNARSSWDSPNSFLLVRIFCPSLISSGSLSLTLFYFTELGTISLRIISSIYKKLTVSILVISSLMKNYYFI